MPTTNAANENCLALREAVAAAGSLPDSNALWHLKLKITARIPNGRKKKAAEIAERRRCGEASETTPKPY